MGFTLAITGRPNVGKSTFFNRLLEQRKAIVDDISGVTRDRQYGITDWNGKSFNVIDTGGFVPHSDDVFEREIRKQVTIAIEEANAIVFMTDAAIGITHLDDAMAGMLRKSSKPVFLVVNKVDNNERMLAASEFYSLGFDKIFYISSISGSGTGELLDAITELIHAEDADATDQLDPLPDALPRRLEDLLVDPGRGQRGTDERAEQLADPAEESQSDVGDRGEVAE